MKSAFETPRRVGVITAFPPGRNSLNEFGFHLVTHMAQNDELDRVVVFADETDQGPPLQIEGTESVVSWKFNSLTNPFRLYQAVRRARVDAVIVEQDISKALSVSSRVYCLQEGRVSLEGASGEVTREAIARAYFGS